MAELATVDCGRKNQLRNVIWPYDWKNGLLDSFENHQRGVRTDIAILIAIYSRQMILIINTRFALTPWTA